MSGHVEQKLKSIAEMTPDERVMEMLSVGKYVKELTEYYHTIRRQVAKDRFPTYNEGTNRALLGQGYWLKGSFNMTYALEKDMALVESCMRNLPPATVSKLLTWKPTLSVSAYKELSDAEKKLIADAVVVKEQLPDFELEVPAT